jgi:hypothetical protein
LRVAAEDKPFYIEGEKLAVRKVSGQAKPQDLRSYMQGSWSGSAHLWWTGAKPEDALELTLPITQAGVYRLGAGFTQALDYGIFDVWLNDQLLLEKLDLYNPDVTHTGTLPLGARLELKTGEQVLRFVVRGANPAARKSHMLGLDVHDCAKARLEAYKFGALKAGMVLTVEPGLYFQLDDLTVPAKYRGIGVRIEDDVLVTTGEPDVLSANAPKELDELEALIGTSTLA